MPLSGGGANSSRNTRSNHPKGSDHHAVPGETKKKENKSRPKKPDHHPHHTPHDRPPSSEFRLRSTLQELESTIDERFEQQIVDGGSIVSNSNRKNNHSGFPVSQKPALSTFKPPPPSTPPPSRSERINRTTEPYIVPVETTCERQTPVVIQTRLESSENQGWARQKYMKCVEKVTGNPFRITKDCCRDWMRHWWWVALLLFLSVVGIIVGVIVGSILTLSPSRSKDGKTDEEERHTLDKRRIHSLVESHKDGTNLNRALLAQMRFLHRHDKILASHAPKPSIFIAKPSMETTEAHRMADSTMYANSVQGAQALVLYLSILRGILDKLCDLQSEEEPDIMHHHLHQSYTELFSEQNKTKK